MLLAARAEAQSPMTAPPLRFDLVAPDSAPAGTPVPIVIRITNATGRPVDAYFTGREIAFDIVVRAADGAVVWRRLAGRAIQSILQVRTFEAGETVELRDVWRQQNAAGKPVAPGAYSVQGIVPGQEPEPQMTEVRRLRIVPP